MPALELFMGENGQQGLEVLVEALRQAGAADSEEGGALLQDLQAAGERRGEGLGCLCCRWVNPFRTMPPRGPRRHMLEELLQVHPPDSIVQEAPSEREGFFVSVAVMPMRCYRMSMLYFVICDSAANRVDE